MLAYAGVCWRMLTDVCSGGGIGGIGVALATQVLSLLALLVQKYKR
jgi:hypothetical protein